MRHLLLAACACLALAGRSQAAEAPLKMVTLQRLIAEAPAGERRFTIRESILCSSVRASQALSATAEMEVGPYADAFRRIFTDAGLHPESEANLFEPGGAGAEYALAGVIKSETYDLCIPYVAQQLLNAEDLTGKSSITIEWQLYSRLEKRVVARTRIASSFSSKQAIKGGADIYEQRNIEENLKLLAADPAIRAALAGPGATPGEMIKPAGLPPLVIAGARTTAPKPIDQAGKGVVVIYAGDGMGSGVLISREGYILTDAHVVGDAASVRLRWADGKTSTATVLRASKPRDVALLKVDAAGQEPLPVRDAPPAVGSTVFAIGSPEGPQFQGTLTRGVVSAVRSMEGLNYIQSDVTTGHGGSGGPLLDEKGYVVGLTVLAVNRDTTSSGLNFFTPIKDAAEFLGLDLR